MAGQAGACTGLEPWRGENVDVGLVQRFAGRIKAVKAFVEVNACRKGTFGDKAGAGVVAPVVGVAARRLGDRAVSVPAPCGRAAIARL